MEMRVILAFIDQERAIGWLLRRYEKFGGSRICWKAVESSCSENSKPCVILGGGICDLLFSLVTKNFRMRQ